MAVPTGKSPVSFLIEVCQKRGIAPSFSLVANEGPVHEPLFVFRLCVDGTTVTGRGASKKKAKQDAAIQMLQEMGVIADDYKDPNEPSTIYDGDGKEIINPVGSLQEFAQKRLITPPEFDFSCKEGSTQSREFECTVRFGRYTEKAFGRAKKAAKRQAAINMLRTLEVLKMSGRAGDEEAAELAPEGAAERRLIEEEEPSVPLDLNFLRMVGAELRPIEPSAGVQLLEFSKRLQRRAASKTWASLIKRGAFQPDNIPMPAKPKSTVIIEEDDDDEEAKDTFDSTEPVPMLERICKDLHWQLNFFEQKSATKGSVMMCEIASKPPAVFVGIGDKVENAKRDAACKAFEYLRIML